MTLMSNLFLAFATLLAARAETALQYVVINSQLVKTLLPDDSEELRQYHAASKDQVATEVAVDLGTEPWMAVGVPSPALNPYAISGLDMDDDWEAQAINTLACNMSHSGYNSENDYY